MSTSQLSPDAVRKLFPALVGFVDSGEQIADGVFLIFQGPGAFTVMAGGEFRYCCPTEAAARRAAAKLAVRS